MGLFSFLTQQIAIDLGTANTVIIHNDSQINVDFKENGNYIIVTDFDKNDITFNVLDNVSINVVLFSKIKSNVNLNVTINENANLKINVISMNNSTTDIYNFNLVKEYATLEMNVLSLAKEAKKEFTEVFASITE